MDLLRISFSGKNGILDWGLWLFLLILICLYLWVLFCRKK